MLLSTSGLECIHSYLIGPLGTPKDHEEDTSAIKARRRWAPSHTPAGNMQAGRLAFYSDLPKSQKDSTGAPSVDFRVITGFQIIGQPLNSESVDNEDPLCWWTSSQKGLWWHFPPSLISVGWVWNFREKAARVSNSCVQIPPPHLQPTCLHQKASRAKSVTSRPLPVGQSSIQLSVWDYVRTRQALSFLYGSGVGN